MGRLVKDVTKQQSPSNIILEEEGKIIDNEEDVANIFNEFFVKQVFGSSMTS